MGECIYNLDGSTYEEILGTGSSAISDEDLEKSDLYRQWKSNRPDDSQIEKMFESGRFGTLDRIKKVNEKADTLDGDGKPIRQEVKTIAANVNEGSTRDITDEVKDLKDQISELKSIIMEKFGQKGEDNL